ncbi:MAG: hypothetical protein E7056_07600 [Lentisphaerae bacterium]|nr:hypothetical protein [Lentisphaerota bacterium]
MKVDFIPVKMRLNLKFGAETIDSILIAHVEYPVYGAVGRGETPLSAAWAWPSELPYGFREKMMCEFCCLLAESYPDFTVDPMSGGYTFLNETLPLLLENFNRKKQINMPYLAALICASPFDIALHDAWGISKNLPTYKTYNQNFMQHDLAWFYQDESFAGLYPQDFLVPEAAESLLVWHLVGGKDLLREDERCGDEIADNYPVSLEKWIERDGLQCLKIKLTGCNAEWDYQRLTEVGAIALKYNCRAISPDFNCMVRSIDYVNDILDKLKNNAPEIYDLLLYVEQPFPYDLENNLIDVHSCSQRKPLFMDESAHDWRLVKLGHQLGWNGVALKVCKTQTGALLSGCWAKQHNMQLMVQDLTNPMLATVPHALLAAQFGTIMGVECNAPQFYPAASLEDEKLRPGLYERRNGRIDLQAILNRAGLGY